MPRIIQKPVTDLIFHVLHRGATRRKIFRKDEDYVAFERALAHTLKDSPVRLLDYCIMPNHWHLLLWPHRDAELDPFMNRLITSHTRRWQEHYHKVDTGNLYQDRYTSFPIQEDGHFLTIARYIERNPVCARLVRQAQDWQWSALHRRYPKAAEERSSHPRLDPSKLADVPLTDWPVLAPLNWVFKANQPLPYYEMDRIRRSVVKGRPYGTEPWEAKIIERLRLGRDARA